MKLQAKTRYGVRAMFDIAFHNAGGPTQAKDIARREEIPLRYLEQIFQDLKRAGIVDSRRGPRGGYYLRRPPETIRLSEVVRALQGPIEEVFSPDAGESVDRLGRGAGADRFGDAPKAKAKGGASGKQVTASMWRELAAHMTKWFDDVSLGDLVKRGVDLGVPRGSAKPPMYFI